MRPKTLVLVAAVTAVAGCTLRNTDARRDPSDTKTVLGRPGGGQVIEPKRCGLRVVILSRPLRDKAVDSAVWSLADEQTVPPETRRDLQANGLRVGVITGALPAAVEAAVNAPPPDKVEPAEFDLPDGSSTLVMLSENVPLATLLHNRDGRAFGRDYKDAGGWYRVTASQDGPTGVALRFVPEVHHGPVQRRYDPLPTAAGSFNTMQFRLKDGQQEETLRELAATLVLQPGQIAAIGCDPDRRGSLGGFLFTQAEPKSDRLLQKVVLVWATRTDPGDPGSKPQSKLFPVDMPDVPGMKEKDNERGGKKEKG